jgi:hypothetical protein
MNMHTIVTEIVHENQGVTTERFGPFLDRPEAERCLTNLAHRPDVRSAKITSRPAVLDSED